MMSESSVLPLMPDLKKWLSTGFPPDPKYFFLLAIHSLAKKKGGLLMKINTANELRHSFLEFFRGKAHSVLPSASLIPVEDPTLLWINSGVATLKPYFSGQQVDRKSVV